MRNALIEAILLQECRSHARNEKLGSINADIESWEQLKAYQQLFCDNDIAYIELNAYLNNPESLPVSEVVALFKDDLDPVMLALVSALRAECAVRPAIFAEPEEAPASVMGLQMALLEWNRKQENPPIAIANEFALADAISRLAVEKGFLVPKSVMGMANELERTAYEFFNHHRNTGRAFKHDAGKLKKLGEEFGELVEAVMMGDWEAAGKEAADMHLLLIDLMAIHGKSLSECTSGKLEELRVRWA